MIVLITNECTSQNLPLKTCTVTFTGKVHVEVQVYVPEW